MAHVRELPPLRLHLDVEVPSGRHYRWGDDEPRPENIPSGLRFSDTMPGGFESLDVTLARKPAVDYSDLERLSTIRVLGVGSEVAWEGRLERVPRASGDQMAVSPSAVGHQAHLEDDKSASIIYIDRDLASWRGMSSARQVGLRSSSFATFDPNVLANNTSGIPTLSLAFQGDWSATSRPACEAWYDAGPGNLISAFRGTWTKSPSVSAGDAQWSWMVYSFATDDATGSSDDSGQLRAVGPGNVVFAHTARRYELLLHDYLAGPAGVIGLDYVIDWTNVRVFGEHGLTVQAGSGPAAEGLLASDVVIDAVGRWAPLLTIESGETVGPSTFAIPHLSFREPTTAGEIVRAATRFGLQDWAVWENQTFWWHDRGARGRRWRARVDSSGLEETGPQVDRLWESVIVQYQDVDGSTRTVGPVSSGADTETDDLKDYDPENPANKVGIIRRDLLQMGVSTVAGATEIGRRFLEESKALNTSGSARIVGHIEDDRGVIHPYWRVRAGDTISFMDASDTSYRRIVRTDKSTADRSCSIDLDSPPEGLQALLERLGVVLVSLGI